MKLQKAHGLLGAEAIYVAVMILFFLQHETAGLNFDSPDIAMAFLLWILVRGWSVIGRVSNSFAALFYKIELLPRGFFAIFGTIALWNCARLISSYIQGPTPGRYITTALALLIGVVIDSVAVMTYLANRLPRAKKA